MTFLLIAITFLWGTGSLLLIAIKTNTTKTIFLKKPSIIIGDFFVLPAVAGIIANSTKNLESFSFNITTLLILLVSLGLTIFSAIRNVLTHPFWIPHLAFYWFMTFIILMFLAKFELNTSWWLVLTGIIFHQSLGVIFPKKFPGVKN